MSRMKRRNKTQGRFDFILVLSVMIVLVVLITISGRDLQKKQDAYALQKAELEIQIAEQEERAQELEQLRKYVQTDSYVEEIAQDKLGLVHSDEILFKLQK